MKRSDLSVGMEVYYVEAPWDWNATREDPDKCRATVVDLDHYTRNWALRVGVHPKGKHIRIRHNGRDVYVTGGQLKGPYAEVASVRKREIRERQERLNAENVRRKERERSVGAVVEEAAHLGFQTVTKAYRDRDAAWVELTAAELHALLVEVREARAVKEAKNVQGCTEAGAA